MTTHRPESSTTPWHSLSPEEVLRAIQSQASGLSEEEARQRLAVHGENVLERQTKDGPIKLLWRQLNNPLIWVLLGSAVLAIALGKTNDGAVVLAVVVINTAIGFYQEFRAGKAIEALGALVPEIAIVLRDGKRRGISAAELVPGDIVALASGDKVPADVRLLEIRNLRIEEAMLTGESVPTEKSVAAAAVDAGIGDRTCMAFGGTLVTYGTATAVVVCTGNNTELGRISQLLKETTDLQTPLTKALASIGQIITIAVLSVSVVMVLVGLYRMLGQGVAFDIAIRDTLIFAIALAVGAIPEGLPAVVTIALAIGVQRMVARKAIVRKLPSVETLGSTTTICSDKTGTLTRNEMTVLDVWTPLGAFEVTGVGYDPVGSVLQKGKELSSWPQAVRTLARDSALCNDAVLSRQQNGWKLTGDPTEGALLTLALKAGLDIDGEREARRRLDVIPFESENQFMATLHHNPSGKQQIILKGAPEVVLRRCSGESSPPVDVEQVLGSVHAMAERGLRVLAIAQKETESLELDDVNIVAGGFQLVGLVGMIDPPRAEAITAVAICRDAGIAVKMITGDHQVTAAAIGRQLGLTDAATAVAGAELERSSDEELVQLVKGNNVFARVAPEHKLRLVKALQSTGEVVAMTGDGVNDAPALKQSNIGVAMGITGTAVSKEAADIVLADDNFASIAAAVEEGRRVYDNLIKSLAFVLPTNLGLALIFIYAVAFFPFDPVTKELLLPMGPVQLLWINLVATVSLALPLAFEAKEADIMKRPPRPPDEPVLSRFVIYRTMLAATFMAAGAIGLFYFEYNKDLAAGVPVDTALQQAQTMTTTTVILFQIFYVITCRSLKGSVVSIGVFSNPSVFLGIGVLVLLQLAFIYVGWVNRIFGSAPISAGDLGWSVAVSATILPIIGIEKWLRKRALSV
jgi:magnesium-transporting ATPase (P-type)